MSNKHVTHLQRMANESWRGSPEHAALTAAIAALSAQQPAAVDEAMVTAAQEQISEGLGAYLRKFTDSEAAMRAREYLHKMPSGEWEGMTRMLAQEALGAALAGHAAGR